MFKAFFTLVLCINLINDQQRSRETINKGSNKCQVTMADQEGPFFEAGKITIQFPSIKSLKLLFRSENISAKNFYAWIL